MTGPINPARVTPTGAPYYVTGVQPAPTAPPQLGEAVELEDGALAVVSVTYSDTDLGVCRVADLYGGAFFYGPTFGPPAPGKREHVEVSGGPHPAYPLAAFRDTGRTVEVPCWHWRGAPCAGGGVNYRRTVRLWTLTPA